MPGFFKSLGNFLTGTPAKVKNVSRLRPEQEGLYQQLVQSGMQPGAGGAFGTAADYYRNLLSDNSADYNAFAAPMLRQYHQDIVPGLSEQFAGMGAGGLSSSGFQNAQIQGATDLSERLGALRAQLRQSGAQGLANIGQMGLGSFSQPMMTQEGTPGLFGALSQGIGNAIGQFGGNWLSGRFGGGNQVGTNTPPLGNNPTASPKIPQRQSLPNFLDRRY